MWLAFWHGDCRICTMFDILNRIDVMKKEVGQLHKTLKKYVKMGRFQRWWLILLPHNANAKCKYILHAFIRATILISLQNMRNCLTIALFYRRRINLEYIQCPGKSGSDLWCGECPFFRGFVFLPLSLFPSLKLLLLFLHFRNAT